MWVVRGLSLPRCPPGVWLVAMMAQVLHSHPNRVMVVHPPHPPSCTVRSMRPSLPSNCVSAQLLAARRVMGAHSVSPRAPLHHVHVVAMVLVRHTAMGSGEEEVRARMRSAFAVEVRLFSAELRKRVDKVVIIITMMACAVQGRTLTVVAVYRHRHPRSRRPRRPSAHP